MTSYPPSYYQDLRRRHAAGDPPMLATSGLMPGLIRLRGFGASIAAISAASGVSKSVVSAILRGQRPTVVAGTARALAGLTLDAVLQAETDPHVLVPDAGSVRRIEANMLAGWSHVAQAEMCGLHTKRVLAGRTGKVQLSTHRAIAGMTSRLAGAPGPSTVTAGRAGRLGYLPLSAWDDIDDPACVAEADGAATPTGDHCLADDAIHLLRGSVGVEEAAARCGIAVDSIMTTLRRRAHRAGPGSADAALYAQILAERARATASARRRAS